MKKILLLIGAIVLSLQVGFAQVPAGDASKRPVAPQHGKNHQAPHFSPEQYVKMKTDYISNHAKLTQQETAAVMPLFHKQKELQRANDTKMRNLRKSVKDDMDDAACLEVLKKLRALQYANLKIEKEYQEKMLQVVSPLKYLRIINAEVVFDRDILHKMMNKNAPGKGVPADKKKAHPASPAQAKGTDK